MWGKRRSCSRYILSGRRARRTELLPPLATIRWGESTRPASSLSTPRRCAVLASRNICFGTGIRNARMSHRFSSEALHAKATGLRAPRFLCTGCAARTLVSESDQSSRVRFVFRQREFALRKSGREARNPLAEQHRLMLNPRMTLRMRQTLRRLTPAPQERRMQMALLRESCADNLHACVRCLTSPRNSVTLRPEFSLGDCCLIYDETVCRHCIPRHRNGRTHPPPNRRPAAAVPVRSLHCELH